MNKSNNFLNMKNLTFFLLFAAAVLTRADEAADKVEAAKYIGIASWNWHIDGFGVIMMADFEITNTSPWDIKDVKITCHHSAASGTAIDENTRTIYKVFRAHTSKTIHDFNMGLIDPQSARSGASIEDFEFVAPHLSLEEIRKRAADAAAQRSENAAAAKAKAAATKKAADEKALASNQAAADKGDAYGLLRMGERYRDGDGVAKDLPTARVYFTKAAAAGSPSAQSALDKLPK